MSGRTKAADPRAGASTADGAKAADSRAALAGPRVRSALAEGIYEVFARRKRGESLRHIGCVDAPGDELARVYAWKTYDEENWFEMCVVPRSAVIPVNRADGIRGGGGASRGGRR